jgi:hypothetical protein
MPALFRDLTQALQSLVRGIVRVAVVALGAVLALVAVVAGLVLTAGVVTWALLRGRKAARVHGFRWGVGSRAGRAPADVVDIEAHEVQDPTARPRALIDR